MLECDIHTGQVRPDTGLRKTAEVRHGTVTNDTPGQLALKALEVPTCMHYYGHMFGGCPVGMLQHI